MPKHTVTRDELRQARRRARRLLRSPRFFNELLLALKKDGLVGEELNALIVFIIVVSRLLRTPSVCSFGGEVPAARTGSLSGCFDLYQRMPTERSLTPQRQLGAIRRTIFGIVLSTTRSGMMQAVQLAQ